MVEMLAVGKVHGCRVCAVFFWGCPGLVQVQKAKALFMYILRTYRANRMKIIVMRRMRFEAR